MVGWHHQLDGHELEQAPQVGDGQGTLAWRAMVHGSQRVEYNGVTELTEVHQGTHGTGSKTTHTNY